MCFDAGSARPASMRSREAGQHDHLLPPCGNEGLICVVEDDMVEESVLGRRGRHLPLADGAMPAEGPDGTRKADAMEPPRRRCGRAGASREVG